MKKIILFATFREAEATLLEYHAELLCKNPHFYSFSKGWIFVSGIGIMPAHYTLLYALHHFGPQVDEVINLGFSADLGKTPSIGEIHTIASVSKHTLLPKLDDLSLAFHNKALPLLTLATQGKKLLSCDYPIHDPLLKDQISQKWDLVDMEGYAIAYGAHQMKKQATLYKITSDFGLPGGHELILAHQKDLSKKLAQSLIKII